MSGRLYTFRPLVVVADVTELDARRALEHALSRLLAEPGMRAAFLGPGREATPDEAAHAELVRRPHSEATS